MGRAHDSRWRGTVAALWAGAVVIAFPAGVTAASAAEPDDGGCPVLAAAQGVQVMASDSDSLLIEQPAGAGAPVAQACVDHALGETTAFASSPYPGQTAVRSAEDYPAYVASRYPGREVERDTVGQPGYELLAKSTATASQARARTALAGEDTGSGSTLSTADTSVNPKAGTAVATAKTDLEPIVINDVLRLGQIRSVATAKQEKGGSVKRESQLQIGRTTVAGQEVVITPRGVEAAGETTGLPSAEPLDTLEQAGVDVNYLAAERTTGGILSAGLEVVVSTQDSGAGGVKTVRYVLGRSFATVAPVESGSGGLPDVPPAPEIPGTPPAVGGSEAEAPSSGPAAISDTGPTPAGPAPEPAPPPTTAPVVAGPVALAGVPIDMGLSGAYLVIVLGAVVMFASGTLLRLLGVKTRWTS